jgi:hypothetical protein
VDRRLDRARGGDRGWREIDLCSSFNCPDLYLVLVIVIPNRHLPRQVTLDV